MKLVHNTDQTIAQIKLHLSFMFKGDVFCEVHSAEDHDCLWSGDPMAAVEVENLLHLYPIDSTKTRWHRPNDRGHIFWGIDLLVDDSDPDVGMFGWEPREHKHFNNLGDALKEVARLVAAHHVEGSLLCYAEAESFSLYG